MTESTLNAMLTRATRARDSLRAALAQSIPADDPIIMGRVQQAEMLIDSLCDMLKNSRAGLTDGGAA
jgi:hypothetical protein